MPSPAIATTRPSAWSCLTTSRLVRPAAPRRRTSSMPELLARPPRRSSRLSPVSMTTRRPSRVELRDGLGRGRLDRIGDAQQPGGLSVDRDEHDGLALAPQLLGRARPAGPTSTPAASSSARLPSATRRAVDRPGHALAGDRLESPRRARERHAALGRAGHDRGGQRMLAGLLEARRQPQQLVLVEAGRRRRTVTEPRLAFGQRAGLVHHQRVDLLQDLERLGVPDQHARRRAAAGADHDRHRRRQPQRARAGDDEHRDGVHQRVAPARLRPDQTPQTTKREHGRQRPPPARTRPRRRRPGAGSARGCAAPRRPCCTICASSVSLPTRSARITKRAGAVDGAAGDRVARLPSPPGSARR